MKTKDIPSTKAKRLAVEANNIAAAQIRCGTYLPTIVHALVFKAFMAGYRHGRKMAGAKPEGKT